MKRWLLALVFAVFVMPSFAAVAQDPTFQQFFIVDVVSFNNNGQVYRSPEHFGSASTRMGNPPDAQLVGVNPNQMDFGLIDVMIVSAFITTTQQTYLQSLPDVIIVPVNIDNTIPQNRFTAITNALNSKNIAALTLSNGDTYRKFLREIAGEAQFFQRWTGITGINPYLLNQNYLSATIGSLREDYQSAIWVSLDAQGYNSSALTVNNTLRQMFNGMASQDDNKTFLIGGSPL